MERNCLLFPNFCKFICKIKSSLIIHQQPIRKIKFTQKNFFFRFSELAKLTFFLLDSQSNNDDHVKNIHQELSR